MKPTFASSIVLVALMLCSCERGTTFYKTLLNNSDIPITITVYDNVSRTNEVTTIDASSSADVYIYDLLGAFPDDSYRCLQEIDSFHIALPDDKILVKDIMNEENWSKEITGKKSLLAKCTLVVEQSDIQ